MRAHRKVGVQLGNAIEVRSLAVTYQNNEKRAVDDISFSIKDGEVVLFAGASASGKSTSMQAICGFVPHIIPANVTGEIFIYGKMLQSPIDIARHIGMVQQEPDSQFCTETVEEEVAFGPENFQFSRDAIEEAVASSLDAVGASHLRFRKLSTLSGGEKQKVAIASVLATKPKILILDEPTASLDCESVSDVLCAIRSLRDKRSLTLIIVEHRLSGFLNLATRLVAMKDGKIVADCEKGSAQFRKYENDSVAPMRFSKIKCKKNIVLSVMDISCRLGGAQILDGVSFDIRAGSIVALMGRNGAGKTTLLRTICGLERLQSGKMIILGKTYTTKNPPKPWEIARDVGLVFQNPAHQLFENTIGNEIFFAPRNFGLDLSCAEKTIKEFEDRERVKRQSHPSGLSFGQKRRLNISSVSSYKPSLLLLDEPFVGQDRQNAEALVRMLLDLRSIGRTIVVVTHEPSFARSFCTHEITLSSGKASVRELGGENEA